VNPKISSNFLQGDPWFTIHRDSDNVATELTWISVRHEEHPSSQPSGLATLGVPLTCISPGRLDQELKRVQRYGLIIIDEVGYLPFEPDAANLFFQLVSSRYENASVILTSNLPFGRWAEVFGDQTIAAAMIDRLVHHAEVHTLTGDSYRTKNRGIDTLASHKPENKTQ
jgi:hypothetical protein